MNNKNKVENFKDGTQADSIKRVISPTCTPSLQSPSHPHFNPLLKARDVARILGISKTQAYRIMGHELPAIQFGRTIRVQTSDLEAFITSHVIVGDQ
ncbi:MAG: helix-turn-helix domain-containing protein [Chloroflexi bacterium]|nr:helix-turn-helix domain-containing protein [Chloroflexota bacterium]